MPLLIDCYNVLRADLPPTMAGMDEAGLCRALAKSRWYGARSSAGRGIVVVADGRVKPMGAATSPVDGVTLIYAGVVGGQGCSADEVIIERVRVDSAPKRLTVVSSDREIRAAARARGATDLPSDLFIERLARDHAKGVVGPRPPSRPRVEPLDAESVDAWLDVFGVEGGGTPPGEGSGV